MIEFFKIDPYRQIAMYIFLHIHCENVGHYTVID